MACVTVAESREATHGKSSWKVSLDTPWGVLQSLDDSPESSLNLKPRTVLMNGSLVRLTGQHHTEYTSYTLINAVFVGVV